LLRRPGVSGRTPRDLWFGRDAVVRADAELAPAFCGWARVSGRHMGRASQTPKTNSASPRRSRLVGRALRAMPRCACRVRRGLDAPRPAAARRGVELPVLVALARAEWSHARPVTTRAAGCRPRSTLRLACVGCLLRVYAHPEVEERLVDVLAARLLRARRRALRIDVWPQLLHKAEKLARRCAEDQELV
jgi:hypothetical protein